MNKGYVYVFLSAVLLTMGVILNKYMLQFVNPRMLAFLWFATVFSSSAIVIALRSERALFNNFRRHWKDGVIVGGFNAVASTFWFMALNLLDASTTAFLVRFSTIFIILIGVFYLKEKLTKSDLLGIAFAIGGAFLINYSNGAYTTLGLIAALTAALGIALHQTAAKMFVKRVHAFNLVNLRAGFTAFFLLLIVLATSGIQAVPLNLIPVLLLGAGVTSVAGFFFFYKSLELIDVSKVAIVRTLDPFIVLIYGFILFRSLPHVQEIIGGSFIVLGVIIIISKHRIKEIVYALKNVAWFG